MTKKGKQEESIKEKPDKKLTGAQAEPSITSVRQPVFSDTVAYTLTPNRLYSIIKNLKVGDARDYLTLAEELEIRDTHYRSVLSTRKMVSKGWWGVKPMQDPLTGETRDVQLGSPRRLETIYNVNMRQAYNVGNYERGQSSKVHTKMMYRVGNSKKHREEHLNWDGLILPKDDPWWDKHMPPNGYGCKCYVKFLTEAGAKRLQEEGILDKTANNLNTRKPVKTTAPLDIPKQYVNKRTGKVYTGVQGITPGFEYNPAIERSRVLEKLLADSSLKYKENGCKAAIKEKFPDVEWRKLADNVYIYKNRLNTRKKQDSTSTNKEQEAILDKEVLQAKSLAKQGHVVYLIPENKKQFKVKQPDAIVDGETLDFKSIEGGNEAISRNCTDALLKAQNAALKLIHNFTIKEVEKELSTAVEKSNRKGTYGTIYVQFSDGSFREWDVNEL